MTTTVNWVILCICSPWYRLATIPSPSMASGVSTTWMTGTTSVMLALSNTAPISIRRTSTAICLFCLRFISFISFL